jgi:pimeloyl-ACP methyl ester carboxylesterase
MPTATVNGSEYYYDEKGSGFPIVFGNSLLFDQRMWDQRLETIAGSGHMTAIEQPERISQLLSEFLAQVDSASPK